jgi:hypothetical protein
MSTLNVSSINSGPIGGMRNALINGNPTINQRGYVSGTATTAANQYTLDRWRVVTSGQNISWTDSANVRTVTAPAGGVEQVVEGINLFSGSYVLSWTGTATATVAGSSVANGATVTLVGGVDTTVRFSGGTFALAQLEPGTRSTPFERRSYGQELALCQRYFETSFSSSGPAVATNTDNTGICSWGGSGNGSFNTTGYIGIMSVPFCVAKRAIPTITSFDTASPRNAGKCERHVLGVPGTNNQVLVISNPGTKGFNAFADNGGASAAGIIFHYTANAEL